MRKVSRRHHHRFLQLTFRSPSVDTCNLIITLYHIAANGVKLQQGRQGVRTHLLVACIKQELTCYYPEAPDQGVATPRDCPSFVACVVFSGTKTRTLPAKWPGRTLPLVRRPRKTAPTTPTINGLKFSGLSTRAVSDILILFFVNIIANFSNAESLAIVPFDLYYYHSDVLTWIFTTEYAATAAILPYSHTSLSCCTIMPPLDCFILGWDKI